MSNVVKLPTAPQTYYTVHKTGPWFDVVLVTPIDDGKPLKTRIYGYQVRCRAIEKAKEVSAKAKRPFKLRGVVQ